MCGLPNRKYAALRLPDHTTLTIDRLHIAVCRVYASVVFHAIFRALIIADCAVGSIIDGVG